MLRFYNGKPFGGGAASYLYQPISEREEAPRILLSVAIGTLTLSAFVDTGGVYFLCPPQVARRLHIYPEDGFDFQRLLFRGVSHPGSLHRLPLTLIAHQGQLVTIDVTAFVPHIVPTVEWPDAFPCILGMSGCLERLRFAIDPETDTFYFGALGE